MNKRFYVLLGFLSVVVVIISKFIIYNTSTDYIVGDNIYGYKNFEYLNKHQIFVDKYYRYLDCAVSDKNFNSMNVEVYKNIDDCSIGVDKINYLAKYYDNVTVKHISRYDFDYLLITDDNYELIKTLVNSKNFDPSKIVRYLNYTGDDVVMNVNLNHDSEPFSTYNIISDINLLTIINSYNRLAQYNTNVVWCDGHRVYSKAMCNDYLKMVSRLQLEGIIIKLEESYYTDDLFSEHAAGLAINIEYEDGRDSLVEKIASEHGFILRYKEEYVNVTKHQEMKHYRYVGSYASEIFQANISLEEFVYNNF